MAEPPVPWETDSFLEYLDRWIEQEDPDDELRLAVTVWIFTRGEDPFQGARRDPTQPNVWFARIPNTFRSGTVVCCAYRVEVAERRVLCDTFATLSLPL